MAPMTPMTVPTISFLLVSLLIGVYASKRIKGSVRNYFVAGNVIPFWVLVFSMTGQAIELGATHDNANLVIGGGFWDGAVLPLGIGCSLILLGLFFAKPLHKLRLLTLPDFYVRRYSQGVGVTVALICIMSFIILIAGNLAGLGVLLEIALGIPPMYSVPCVALLVMTYTIAGGLFAVTWNDVLQIGVSIVAFVVGIIWIFFHLEPGEFTRALGAKFSWTPLVSLEAGSLRLWASLLALALGDIVALDFMERVFAAGTPRGAQWSCIVAGVMTMIMGLILAVLGAVAASSMQTGDQSILAYIQHHLPAGLGMIFIMGFIGAGVSTIDGAVMACSVCVSRNVLQSWFPKAVSEARLLKVSRGMALPVTAIGVLLALVFPVPAELLVLAFDVVFAGCLVPLVLGLYWKRGSARAAFFAIVIPSVIRLALHFLVTDLWKDPRFNGLQTLLPPLFSFFIFVAVTVYDENREKKMRAPV